MKETTELSEESYEHLHHHFIASLPKWPFSKFHDYKILLSGKMTPEQLSIWLIVIITFSNGLLNVILALFIQLPYSIESIVYVPPFWTAYLNKSLTIILGFFLIYLSFELEQRKKIAWYITIVLLLVSIATHVFRATTWYTSLIPLVSLLLLLVFHKHFQVRSEVHYIERGIFLSVAIGFLALIYGIIGLLILDKSNLQNLNSIILVVMDLIRIIFFQDNYISYVPATPFGSWFIDSIHLIECIALFLITISLFRPLIYNYVTLPADREYTRQLLERYGGSSLDYFKLWPDKSYFFSPNKETVIAYKVKLGVAVCFGDPIGSPEQLEKTIELFLNYCITNGWRIAFHHVLPNLIPTYKYLGFSVIKIGQEAIIDLEHFVTSTSKGTWFKRIINKFIKEGFTIIESIPPHTQEVLREIQEISNEWLSFPGRRERSFSLGSFSLNYLQTTSIVILRDQNNNSLAFMNQIPSYTAGEATIDMMRHRKIIPNGSMDFLFTMFFLKLKEKNFKRFNLGLAPFSGIGDTADSLYLERMFHELFLHFNRVFSFKGLRAYKEKFQPRWEDRYIVYKGGPKAIIEIILAIIRITDN